MEALARVVWVTEAEGGGLPLLHPDLLVATDSHTPMINALRLSGRDEEHVRLVDAYLTAQGLKRTDDRPKPSYDQVIDLDLGTVEPSLAGPRLPHQRLPLSAVPDSFRASAPRTEPGAQVDEFGEPLPDGPVAIAAITS